MRSLTPRTWLSAVGAVPCLVQLLHSTPAGTPRARTVRRFFQDIAACTVYLDEGSSGHKAALDGVIPPLVSMLLHQDNAFACHVAAMAIADLAVNVSNQIQIMEAGGIAPLVQLLYSGSEDLHYPAARALVFIAEERKDQPVSWR